METVKTSLSFFSFLSRRLRHMHTITQSHHFLPCVCILLYKNLDAQICCAFFFVSLCMFFFFFSCAVECLIRAEVDLQMEVIIFYRLQFLKRKCVFESLFYLQCMCTVCPNVLAYS